MVGIAPLDRELNFPRVRTKVEDNELELDGHPGK
jgi:hypothetical protein